jgi:hypothetical protein
MRVPQAPPPAYVPAQGAFLSSKGESSCNFLQSCASLTRLLQGEAVARIPPRWDRESKERPQMWLYVQMWFPLMTIALAAAICLGVVYFIKRPAKQP